MHALKLIVLAWNDLMPLVIMLLQNTSVSPGRSPYQEVTSFLSFSTFNQVDTTLKVLRNELSILRVHGCIQLRQDLKHCKA